MLEKDIRRRNLLPGDAYMSTAETAQMLGVSANVANSALRLLVKRRIIDRKQRRGAVIAHPPTECASEAFQRVHIVVNQRYVKQEGLYSDGLTVGLQGVVPNAEIQFNYLPSHHEDKYIQRLIDAAQTVAYPVGFVISKASIPVQRLMARSGLPSLVHGGLHLSHTALSSIDRDNVQTGHILTRYMIEQRCKRIIVLNRNEIYPGDHDLLDGITATMDEAKLPTSALIWRVLVTDEDIVCSEVEKLLTQSRLRTGIIAQSERHAKYASVAVEAVGKKIGVDVPIALVTLFRRGKENPSPFPHIRLAMTPEQQGELIGQMLLNIYKGKETQPKHIRIPVELEAGA
ncbi:MAG: GntR family transcriptional regulator [Phycisphaeraceae bacterium]|nr:GntR family transcriptional regulator [Phycisphaeraceae bacterium]